MCIPCYLVSPMIHRGIEWEGQISQKLQVHSPNSAVCALSKVCSNTSTVTSPLMNPHSVPYVSSNMDAAMMSQQQKASQHRRCASLPVNLSSSPEADVVIPVKTKSPQHGLIMSSTREISVTKIPSSAPALRISRTKSLVDSKDRKQSILLEDMKKVRVSLTLSLNVCRRHRQLVLTIMLSPICT